MYRRFVSKAMLATLGIVLARTLPPPPERPGLGSTFKRPISQLNVGQAPNGPGLHIGNDVPAVISAFYVANYGATAVSLSWISQYVDANNYRYMIVGDLGLVNPFGAHGWVIAGVVKDLPLDQWDGAQMQRLNGFVTRLQEQYLNAQIIGGDGNGSGVYADFTWDNSSVSRGTIAGARASSTTTVTTSGTVELDLPFLAMSPFTFVGRVYEGFCRLLCTQTVATDVFGIIWRRDTALTGTQVGLDRFSTGATTGGMGETSHVINDNPARETLNLFISVVRVAGTGTLTVAPRVTGGNSRLSSYSKYSDVGGTANSGWVVT